MVKSKVAKKTVAKPAAKRDVAKKPAVKKAVAKKSVAKKVVSSQPVAQRVVSEEEQRANVALALGGAPAETVIGLLAEHGWERGPDRMHPTLGQMAIFSRRMSDGTTRQEAMPTRADTNARCAMLRSVAERLVASGVLDVVRVADRLAR